MLDTLCVLIILTECIVEKGASVTSVSKTGTIPTWANNEQWTNMVDWKSADLLSSQDALDSAVGTPDAVVSCVGVVGTDADELLKGNGNANVAAFNSAKRGGNLIHKLHFFVELLFGWRVL